MYQQAEAGRLPHLRVGGLLRFDPERVRAFVRGETSTVRALQRPGAAVRFSEDLRVGRTGTPRAGYGGGQALTTVPPTPEASAGHSAAENMLVQVQEPWLAI